MAVTLDPALEQRIQRHLERGAFREPTELLAHALDLLEADDCSCATRTPSTLRYKRQLLPQNAVKATHLNRPRLYSPKDVHRAILLDSVQKSPSAP